MSTFDRLADLPVVVDGYALEGRAADTGAGWTRRTTILRLAGGGREGLGEEINYSEADQLTFLSAGAVLELQGCWSLATLSRRLEELDPGPAQSEFAGQDVYRRWAFESAALDLALRQAGASLSSILDVEPRPVRFVASMGLGDDNDLRRLRALRAAKPGLGLKLDAGPSWDDALLAELAGTGRVEVVDFKGAYEGTPVDTEPDPELYRRTLEALPEALIEDPHRTPEILELLEPHRERVSWDAPIHSVEDLESAPWEPRVVNFKPSRFGTLERLFDAYDHCARRGIRIYGGGQFELGPGRGQVQLLAALFHPDAPNDVAPVEYNVDGDPTRHRDSPLPAPPDSPGFVWPPG